MRYAIFILVFFLGGGGLPDARPLPFVDSRFPVKVTHDVAYATAPVRSADSATKPLLLDLYEPNGDAAPRLRPGFVAVHGGGLTRGDKRTENMVELCHELAARGYVCLSINYRLRGDDPPAIGDTPFARTLNAAIADAGKAVRWLHDNAKRYRVDHSRIAVGGSSAGATIALRLAYEAAPRRVPIAAVFSWVGGLNGDEQILDAGEPPLFIVHGADDDLVPVGEARALARRAAQSRLSHKMFVCEGLGHNVPLDRRPAGTSLYRHLAEFLHANMDLTSLGRRPRRKSPRMQWQNAPTESPAVPCPH
jgi:acetyl esterase/lipase